MAAHVMREQNRLLVVVRDPLASCPKCGEARADRPACPRCGLWTDRMDAYRASRSAAVPDTLQRAWQRARSHWQVPAVHDEVLDLARQHECYAWVAAQYRDAAQTNDVVAVAQLARIRRALEVSLTIQAIARPSATATRGPYRGMRILVTLLVLGVVGAWIHARLRPAPSQRAKAAMVGRAHR